jgi:hypothetical protein
MSKPRAESLAAACGGAAIIEFAVPAPMFLALVFGSIEYGRLLWTQQALQQAAVAGQPPSSRATQIPSTPPPAVDRRQVAGASRRRQRAPCPAIGFALVVEKTRCYRVEKQRHMAGLNLTAPTRSPVRTTPAAKSDRTLGAEINRVTGGTLDPAAWDSRRPELRPELHPRGNRRAPYYWEDRSKTKRLRCLDRGPVSREADFGRQPRRRRRDSMPRLIKPSLNRRKPAGSGIVRVVGVSTPPAFVQTVESKLSSRATAMLSCANPPGS